MKQRHAFALSAMLTLALAAASPAGAQTSELRGRVTYIDPAASIIYFEDGRWAKIAPGTTLLVDGRHVVLGDVRPGTMVVMQGAPQPVPQAVAMAPLPPLAPIDANGIVAAVDPTVGYVTFQDGRTVRVTDSSRLWQQPAGLIAVRPGTQLFVQNAQPVAYQMSGATVPAGRYMMGTVVGVDPAGGMVRLHDGQTVRVGPTTRVRAGQQIIALSQVQPGDQIVVYPREGTVVAVPATTETVVRASDPPGARAVEQRVTIIEANEMVIVHRPQSP